MTQSFPKLLQKRLIQGMQAEMPDVDPRHITPKYFPWEQRVCAISDSDLFQAVNSGRVTLATDTIQEFTERGVRLGSGEELEADIVVTATGFNLQRRFPVNSMEVLVDGKPYEPSSTVLYRNMMLSEVPNLFFSCGYINASWTLRSDIVACFICRMLNHMESQGLRQVCPRLPADKPIELAAGPMGNFTPGYVQRVLDEVPKQGAQEPWRVPMYYPIEKRALERATFDDGVLDFSSKAAPPIPVSRL